MGKKTDELIDILEQLIQLLDADNEESWKEWCDTVKNSLKQSDFSGITKFLSGFGGMESFNDLIIGQTFSDGKVQWKKGAKASNNKLTRLRTKAFELATYIKHNAEVAE